MPPANDPSEDYEQVVDQRSERGKQKQAMREQNCRNYAAHIKENLCRKQDACEMNAELNLIGRESFHEPAHELRGEDFRDDSPDNHDGGHHADDD